MHERQIALAQLLLQILRLSPDGVDVGLPEIHFAWIEPSQVRLYHRLFKVAGHGRRAKMLSLQCQKNRPADCGVTVDRNVLSETFSGSSSEPKGESHD